MSALSTGLGDDEIASSGSQLIGNNPPARYPKARLLDEFSLNENVDEVVSHTDGDLLSGRDKAGVDGISVESKLENTDGLFGQFRQRLLLKFLTLRLKLCIFRIRFYLLLARVTHRLAMVFLRLQYRYLEAHYSRLKVDHLSYNLRIASLFGKIADLFAELNRFIYFGKNHFGKSGPDSSVGQPAKGEGK